MTAINEEELNLEALQRLIDLEEIRQVQLNYAAANELLDIDALMELFTEDAVLVYPEEYGGDWVGSDVIRENFAYWMKEEKAPFNALYVITNPHTKITGPGTATGRWTFTNYLTVQGEAGPLVTPGGADHPLFILGMYEADYQKVNKTWKIARMKLTSFWPERDYTQLMH